MTAPPLDTLAVAALVLALLPLALTVLNLPFFPRAPRKGRTDRLISVLIPARDEAANIEAALRSVLADRATPLEVIVLDDHSTDGTAEIVRRMMAEDGRVRLETAPPLPAGWSGKQHACRVLAHLAQGDILLFMDADVRLEPGAPGRMAACFNDAGLHLVSGFPREDTRTLGERLIIPQIHVVLLGYLPMGFARLFRRSAAFAAGCGQLMAVRRAAYDAIDGHAAPTVRASMHDGVTLPRAIRRAGYATACIDASDLARCRMYDGWRATWDGFSKNATEGMATPIGLPVWTVLLFGGHVLPWLLIPWGILAEAPSVAWMGLGGVAATLMQRAVLAVRTRQCWRALPWHPVGVIVLLAVQWVALVRSWNGHRPSWRGRRIAESRGDGL
jgi:hypothetical protein